MLSRGAASAGDGARADAPAAAMAAGLLLVAALSLTAGVLVWTSSGWALPVALLALVAFIAGGVVNGALLYGRPRAAGVLANIAYSVVVATALLWRGRERH